MMLNIVEGKCTQKVIGRRYRFFSRALKNLVSTVSRDGMFDWIVRWLGVITEEESQMRRWEEFEACKAAIFKKHHEQGGGRLG